MRPASDVKDVLRVSSGSTWVSKDAMSISTNPIFVFMSYYLRFENRIPEDFVPDSKVRTLLFQILSLVFIGMGIAYLWWRWNYSLNPDALWFAVPLVMAETLAFAGSLLIVINYWSNKDPVQQKPIHFISELKNISSDENDHPVSIDVFIASYNEDLELVRQTMRDAKKMHYPFEDVKINIHLLDDGRRDGRDSAKENFKALAEEEGVNYFSRENNIGFKAGNLNNAFMQTKGDLIVILDADTRPFENFLVNTTGYFQNKKLAWAQTPQWFYDLTEPKKIFGIITGKDIFGNEPKLFYDAILRRRNNYNASFCCGAGSIHRREALKQLAEKHFAGKITEDKTPFMLHASEDIYTSMFLHAEGWHSIQHQKVECKMLSPQSLDGWVKQRTRYATGSLDIGFGRYTPLFLPGLSFWQRVSYLTTLYSYFSPLWLVIFLISPAIFFFTLTPPVMAFNFDFFKYFIPFMALNTLVIALGNWGISTRRSEQYYVASFWLFLKSLWTVLIGKKVAFNVTSKNISIGDKSFRHTLPHIFIIGITLAGMIYNFALALNGQHPSYSAFTANCIWGTYNIYQLSAFVRAGLWKNELVA